MKSIIQFAIPIILGGSAPSLWAACTVTSPDNNITAGANGDSCTNSIAINTTSVDTFGMDAGTLTSVTLINAAAGTITTSGDGSAGVHSEGEGAIIVNHGSITTSGGGSPSYFADGINALGNNSQVINTGTVSVTANGMYGVWFGSSLGGSLNNSGTISAAGAAALGVSLGGSTVNFINSGTIAVSGVDSRAVGAIGSVENFNNSGQIISTQSDAVVVADVTDFTNTGAITSSGIGTYGIDAAGIITTLNNAQGGNAASNATTALTYTGNLPTNYNIIVNSPSHYGQLAGTALVGSTTFGIYAGSILAKGTYASALSGFAATNLMGSTSGNYNGFSWSLNNSSGTIWDLVVSGASTADTQQSLVNTASVLQNTFTLQNTVLANSFTYDCNVFGANNICISAGGRNTAVQAANGLNNTSGLLIAAYRAMPTIRVGAYIDQNLSVNNAGSTVNLGNNTPLIGLFGVWNERQDGTGAQVKVSAAYGQKNATITRQVVGTSEAGSGSSQLNSQGAQVIAKYGFGFANQVVVSPYVGVRYTQNNMGGYTEGTSSSVTAPLTYSSLNTNATTALAGLEGKYRIAPQATVFASAGVETDTNTSNGSYTATGIVGLSSVNFNPNPVTTRPTAAIGATYDVAKNQRLGVTGIYRQEPYQAVSTTTVMATYTVGL